MRLLALFALFQVCSLSSAYEGEESVHDAVEASASLDSYMASVMEKAKAGKGYWMRMGELRAINPQWVSPFVEVTGGLFGVRNTTQNVINDYINYIANGTFDSRFGIMYYHHRDMLPECTDDASVCVYLFEQTGGDGHSGRYKAFPAEQCRGCCEFSGIGGHEAMSLRIQGVANVTLFELPGCEPNRLNEGAWQLPEPAYRWHFTHSDRERDGIFFDLTEDTLCAEPTLVVIGRTGGQVHNLWPLPDDQEYARLWRDINNDLSEESLADVLQPDAVFESRVLPTLKEWFHPIVPLSKEYFERTLSNVMKDTTSTQAKAEFQNYAFDSQNQRIRYYAMRFPKCTVPCDVDCRPANLGFRSLRITVP
ncbi:unnamed protein product [Vitrella brassicaformis CCMP3155]|uniref:Uncharacterized protein n=1 Tax=Vitrella brassicaformis (strain CCMP3155) TaxID=1169540 RepID=A0A0G4ELF2_VITBC|nr:unnamed protein product [Vitrella brassicaformis CCMP3155]|eukprot:CEL98243.1 unnamed protein product [Vitrella brassicaformis CCMP3155]